MHLIEHAYPVHVFVYCVCLGGKWSGEWQISRNFGACGAAGKFFSKFRETLANPNTGPVGRLSCRTANECELELHILSAPSTVCLHGTGGRASCRDGNLT